MLKRKKHEIKAEEMILCTMRYHSSVVFGNPTYNTCGIGKAEASHLTSLVSISSL